MRCSNLDGFRQSQSGLSLVVVFMFGYCHLKSIQHVMPKAIVAKVAYVGTAFTPMVLVLVAAFIVLLATPSESEMVLKSGWSY